VTSLLPLLTNKYAQIALAVVVGLTALWGFGSYKHSLGYSQAQSERHVADLESFRTESERLQALSATVEVQLAQLRSLAPQFLEDYENVSNETPLPTDCTIDPDRLRQLNATIEAANTRKSSESVRGSASGGVK
jgi:hypothetical protein